MLSSPLHIPYVCLLALSPQSHFYTERCHYLIAPFTKNVCTFCTSISSQTNNKHVFNHGYRESRPDANFGQKLLPLGDLLCSGFSALFKWKLYQTITSIKERVTGGMKTMYRSSLHLMSVSALHHTKHTAMPHLSPLHTVDQG